MGGTISWSIRGAVGGIRKGKMYLSQLQTAMWQQEKVAAEKMAETGADHVLYAAKIYGPDDRLVTVQFYMNPMSDKEFRRVTGRTRGAIIYALHRR